jgi:hypothetical protein
MSSPQGTTKTPLFIKCRHCGRSFRTWPCRLKERKRFCSRKCYGQALAKFLASYGANPAQELPLAA